MPLCARCSGAAVGQVVSVVLLAAGALPPAWMAVLMAGVMLADWSVQEYLGIVSTNPRRLLTGILGGLGVATLYWLLGLFVWEVATMAA